MRAPKFRIGDYLRVAHNHQGWFHFHLYENRVFRLSEQPERYGYYYLYKVDIADSWSLESELELVPHYGSKVMSALRGDK